MLHWLLFSIFAILAVAAAINLLVQRHPINSALSLIVVMGSLAVEYLLLGAEFVAAIQVIVYAGAIMVLFLFVIMLLDVRRTEVTASRVKLQKPLGILLGVAFFLETVLVLRSSAVKEMARQATTPVDAEFGTAVALGRALFTHYAFPLQLAAILLFVALIGAVVLAKRRS
jgi:NADH-quinone oxidoreductase subunit J